MKPRIALFGALTMGALLGTGALAGCSSGHDTPSGENATDSNSNQPGSDAWITTKVKADLATTGGVSSTDISVKTRNGVVTLTGVVDSQAEVDKAVAAARSIKGVTEVDSSGLKVGH